MANGQDYFAKLLVDGLRGTAVELANGLCNGSFDSPGHREYQQALSQLSANQKTLFIDTLTYCVNGAINDTVHQLDRELNSAKSRISLVVDGDPVGGKEHPSKLHSKLWGKNGLLTHSK